LTPGEKEIEHGISIWKAKKKEEKKN